MATDLYLPAIPVIAGAFGVDTQIIELSISTYLLGFAGGQLLAAPVSDRLGRRPAMLTGLSVFLVSTVAIIYVQTADQLLYVRCIQGIGGGACAVNIMAMIGDLYTEHDAARMYSLVHLFGLTVPLVAPAIGALLIAYFPWEASFVFLASYCAVAIIFAVGILNETLQRERQTVSFGKVLRDVSRDYWEVVSRRGALWFNALTALGLSTFFIYLTDAAFVYIDYFGCSISLFPFLFGANIISMMVCNRINFMLLHRMSPQQVIRIGHTIQILATGALLLSSWLAKPVLIIFLPLVMLSVGSNAFIIGNTTARYISLFDTRRGAASAVAGLLQFSSGAVISIGLSLVHDGTPFTMAAGMFVCAALAVLVSVRISRLSLPGPARAA